MKNQITRTLFLVTVLVIGIVLTSFVLNGDGDDGSESEGGFVLVRTYEINGMSPSTIIVSYEDGRTEEFALKGLRAKNFADNLSIIQKKLNEFKNNGYELISSNGGNSDNVVTNTYVFQK